MIAFPVFLVVFDRESVVAAAREEKVLHGFDLGEQRLGHFVTESSEHNAEYNAHFIPHGQDIIARYDVPVDEYLRRCDSIVDRFERLKKFSQTNKPIEFKKNPEYGSLIIHPVVTGQPRVIYGNMQKLDLQKTLVPTSGKCFNPPTARALRASWDAACKSAEKTKKLY